MSIEIQNIIFLAAAFLLLFAVAEILYHQCRIKSEYTRKIVHVGTGLITLLFPILLSNHWSVLFLCTSFFIILILSLKYHFLKSINAIDRVSYGSLSYPLVVYICFLVWEKVEKTTIDENTTYTFFYLPILILALADPAAALVGTKYPLGIYKISGEKKSFSGSFTFFCIAFTVCILFFSISSNLNILTSAIYACIIASITAFIEAISKKGLDNLTIPIVVLITLYILIVLS